MSNEVVMDINAVMRQLPHRYPFLLVDRVVACDPGSSLVAIKNVTINEPFFQGHFPIKPVMPGVLIIEALAQATGLLAFATQGHSPENDTLYYFVGIDNARFRKPVEPGDQLRLNINLLKHKRDIWKFHAEAVVDDAVVASADLMCARGDA